MVGSQCLWIASVDWSLPTGVFFCPEVYPTALAILLFFLNTNDNRGFAIVLFFLNTNESRRFGITSTNYFGLFFPLPTL
jgi:hypothetical protein